MKNLLRSFFSAALLTSALAISSSASAAESGWMELGDLKSSGRGRCVDVDLGPGVLKLASLFARAGDPEAARLISGITRVRVNVLGIDESNRAAVTDRMTSAREKLSREGWSRIVSVQDGQDEDVAVFLKQSSGEVIEGIMVTVLNERKKEAVFVNVVGNIRPEQIGNLAEHLKVKHLAVLPRSVHN